MYNGFTLYRTNIRYSLFFISFTYIYTSFIYVVSLSLPFFNLINWIEDH